VPKAKGPKRKDQSERTKTKKQKQRPKNKNKDQKTKREGSYGNRRFPYLIMQPYSFEFVHHFGTHLSQSHQSHIR
jgi:hypothetical protein